MTISMFDQLSHSPESGNNNTETVKSLSWDEMTFYKSYDAILITAYSLQNAK